MKNNLNDEEFASFLAYQKWKIYFEYWKNGECHSEFLKISQFFALLLRNTNTQWVFSLIQAQWTKERNMLNVEWPRCVLFIQCNFWGVSYAFFHTFMKSSVQLQNQNLIYRAIWRKTTRELATDCALCMLYTDVINFCSSLCIFAFKLRCWFI